MKNKINTISTGAFSTQMNASKRKNLMGMTKLFLLTFSLFGLAANAQCTRSSQTVGVAGFSPGQVDYTSIAIDGSGTPYVVYSDVANSSKATVKKFNGSAWVTVGSAGFSTGQAAYTAIAIDGSGTPYVVYSDVANSSKATVMKFNGSAWVTVGSAGFSAGQAAYTSIAIDGSGTPYVAYSDFSNNLYATVMKFNGSSWVLVGSQGFSGAQAYYTSIAINGSGTPYVVFKDWGIVGKASVMQFNGSSWVLVGSQGFSGAESDYTNIAIDGGGTPYVVYLDKTYYKANVMKFNGSTWVNVGSTNFSAGIAYYTQIAIDGSGTPYVVYSDNTNSDKATVMKFNGSTWVNVSSAGFSAGTAYYTSIAIDGSGTPYVVYSDYGNSQKATVVNFPYTLPPVSVNSATICSGKSATLTPGGASTYTITGGAFTVSPGTTTSYTVTGSDVSGCTNTAVATVSVKASPTVSINSATICSGQPVTLTPGGASTYTISGGTFIVSPVNTSTYSVTGTATNACVSSNTAVASVLVNTTPTVVITNTTICSGNSFSIVPTGAISYTYQGGSALVSPLTTTNYTVQGSSGSGCVSNVVTCSVTVNASPNVTITPSSTVICSANTVSLTAGGAVSYLWSNNSTTLSTANPFITGPNANFTRTVTGTAVNGCTNQAVQTILVNTSPTVSIAFTGSVICSGKTSTLTASGANTYVWVSGPSAAANPVSPNSTTIYTVTGTNSAGGCTDVATQNIIVNPSPTVNISVTNGTICSGNTTTLTASGANSYVWTSGPSTPANAVNPTSTTIYTVTGTNTVGSCTNTATQNIVVNATPTLNIAYTSSVICSGKTTTLTASGANTYAWASGPSTAANPVSPNANATYTVTGTNTAGSCTSTATQSVAVNASPTLNIAFTSSVICSSKTTTLTASGANSYVWASGPSTASSAVSPNATTIYTVTGTNTIGSCTNAATQSVVVNPTPTLNIAYTSSVICLGNTTTLTASGANTFVWASGPSTAANPVNPTATTIYTVTGTNTAGSCTNTATQSIVVNNLPTVSIVASSTVVCSVNSATLTAGGAATYTWSNALGNNTIVTVSSTSNYTRTVIGSAANGCTNSASQSMVVNATPTINIAATNTVICSGNTTTLTASGANTFSWSNAITSSTNVVSPIVTTVYNISGTTTASGCTNTALQTISVNATPVLTVTPVSSTICSGDASNLLASGAINYTWTNGPLTAGFAANPTTTSVYTVTGETAGCEGLASLTVNVNQNPTLTVNSGTVCTGNSFTISASGANSYSWSNGASSSSINVSPPTNTVYIVIGTGINNCTSTATSTLVVANNLVVNIVPSSTAVCAGASVTLTANGGNTFLWNNSTTSSSIVLNPTTASTYSVIGSSGPSCSNTASQLISINPSPTLTVSGINFICSGVTSILTAGGANSYTWNTGANTTTISVTPAVTSTYTVTGSNSFNCTNTAQYQVQTTPVVTPTICLVTVDSASINNEIYWDKASYPEADTFIVYRESSAAFYSVIARLSKNALGSYVDTNRSIGPNNGNPNYSSYKYKIQFRDTCGNLSQISDYHKTIFIQDNQTGNFTWNYYNIGGVDQQSVNYVLYRRNVLSGVTTSVGGTSGTAFTDPQYSALATAGNVKWFTGMSGFSCDPNARLSSTTAQTISTTKSNVSNEKQFPVVTIGLNENSSKIAQLSVYPNPVENQLTLDFGKTEVKLNLELIDVTGRLISKEVINGNKFYLSTSDLTNGIYFIKLYESHKLLNTQKIIVQH
ncbi:T9SS type A sorting domain-containing protein [Aurantibacillus circumpalustris]|uniref:T9SS type A sorting domain-containing protein n=1 Tax=Aurantibacillus circumpalustris TaxID=3036359 RepID=UPI00295ADB0A|nr:T9SS type A sorting domain-containing protein [Aurantibacillus circumpalustris]